MVGFPVSPMGWYGSIPPYNFFSQPSSSCPVALWTALANDLSPTGSSAVLTFGKCRRTIPHGKASERRFV